MRKALLAGLALVVGLTLFGPILAAQEDEEALKKQRDAINAKLAALQKKDAEPPKGEPPLQRGTGYIPLTPEKRRYYEALSSNKHGGRLKMMADNQALPAAFDCRDKVPLPIWDQGSCGSCYLVATVRTATCTLIGAGYGKSDSSFMLSNQFGMDRPRNFGGCGGGNGTEVIDWMIRNGWSAETYVDAKGVVHNDYPPYEARSGSDRTKAGAKLWMKDASWGFVNANGKPTVAELKAAIVNFGRLNIALSAGGQFMNGTGTITALGTGIDHEINVVAYDDNKDGGSFLLENQWSEDWGVKGCRWCTYKAAARIVDWFFVSVAPLPPPPDPGPPPPPPPPDPPPAPLPGAYATITVSGSGDSRVTTIVGQFPAGQSFVIPAGTTVGDLLNQPKKAP